MRLLDRSVRVRPEEKHHGQKSFVHRGLELDYPTAVGSDANRKRLGIRGPSFPVSPLQLPRSGQGAGPAALLAQRGAPPGIQRTDRLQSNCRSIFLHDPFQPGSHSCRSAPVGRNLKDSSSAKREKRIFGSIRRPFRYHLLDVT